MNTFSLSGPSAFCLFSMALTKISCLCCQNLASLCTDDEQEYGDSYGGGKSDFISLAGRGGVPQELCFSPWRIV